MKKPPHLRGLFLFQSKVDHEPDPANLPTLLIGFLLVKNKLFLPAFWSF